MSASGAIIFGYVADIAGWGRCDHQFGGGVHSIGTRRTRTNVPRLEAQPVQDLRPARVTIQAALRHPLELPRAASPTLGIVDPRRTQGMPTDAAQATTDLSHEPSVMIAALDCGSSATGA